MSQSISRCTPIGEKRLRTRALRAYGEIPLYNGFNPPPGLTFPIELPPHVPMVFTEGDLWDAGCKLYREKHAARLKDAVCPPGAALIPLGIKDDRKAARFALIDEEDFKRVAQHNWHTWTRNGKTYAVTGIDGHSRCLLSRFVLGITHQFIQVRHIGETIDCRKKHAGGGSQPNAFSVQVNPLAPPSPSSGVHAVHSWTSAVPMPSDILLRPRCARWPQPSLGLARIAGILKGFAVKRRCQRRRCVARPRGVSQSIRAYSRYIPITSNGPRSQ
jgi:hypothetical protein